MAGWRGPPPPPPSQMHRMGGDWMRKRLLLMVLLLLRTIAMLLLPLPLLQLMTTPAVTGQGGRGVQQEPSAMRRPLPPPLPQPATHARGGRWGGCGERLLREQMHHECCCS